MGSPPLFHLKQGVELARLLETAPKKTEKMHAVAVTKQLMVTHLTCSNTPCWSHQLGFAPRDQSGRADETAHCVFLGGEALGYMDAAE